MIFGASRSSYVARCRFYTDDVRPTYIVWDTALPGAQVYRGITPFHPDRNKYTQDPLVAGECGELDAPYRRFKRDNPRPTVSGDHTDGIPADFRGESRTPPLNPDGTVVNPPPCAVAVGPWGFVETRLAPTFRAAGSSLPPVPAHLGAGASLLGPALVAAGLGGELLAVAGSAAAICATLLNAGAIATNVGRGVADLAPTLHATGAGAIPPFAGYTNGTAYTAENAWVVSSGYYIGNSFPALGGGPSSRLSVVLWVNPGAIPLAIDYSVTTYDPAVPAPDGTLALTATYVRTDPTSGFDLYLCTAPWTVTLPPGTLWLQLSNAVASDGGYVFWDESDGPSVADAAGFPGIGSEWFAIDGPVDLGVALVNPALAVSGVGLTAVPVIGYADAWLGNPRAQGAAVITPILAATGSGALVTVGTGAANFAAVLGEQSVGADTGAGAAVAAAALTAAAAGSGHVAQSTHSLAMGGGGSNVLVSGVATVEGSFTVLLWFKPASLGTVILLGHGVSNGWRCQLSGANPRFYDGTADHTFTTLTVGTGWWSSMAFKVSGTSCKCFLRPSGGSVATETQTITAPANAPSNFYLGDVPFASFALYGGQDYSAVFPSALADSDINSLLAGTADPATFSPALFWKLNEGTGATAADASTSGYTGTITGATWSTDVAAELS